jgi:hypothetical protein
MCAGVYGYREQAVLTKPNKNAPQMSISVGLIIREE